MYCDGWVFSQNVQVGIGYQGGDFDNVIVFWIQFCYFKIDLNEVVFICIYVIFYFFCVIIFI